MSQNWAELYRELIKPLIEIIENERDLLNSEEVKAQLRDLRFYQCH